LSALNRDLGHIESIRAFAAISVALFHFINFSSEEVFVENETVKSLSVYGAQGVGIFYTISGFIIAYSLFVSNYTIKNYFRYLGKRLIRLYPPYIATIIAINLVTIILCTFIWYTEFDINVKQIVVNVFFLSDVFPAFDWINPIFATLKVELQFYLMIGLIFPIIIKNSYLLILTLATFLLLGIFTKDIDTVFINAPYFCTGIVAFFIYKFGWKWEYIIVLILIISMMYVYFQWENMIATALAFSLIMWLPTNFKPLRLTGRISYSFYLIHGLIGGWFLYFTSDTIVWKNYSWLLILFALLLSWIGAFLMFHFIEKPSLKISNPIKYRIH